MLCPRKDLHRRSTPWGALLSVLFVASFTSCAPGGNGQAGSASAPQTEPASLAPEASIGCADPKRCSPSVALISVVDGDSLSSCTASVVGENLILTASHCLPERLRKADADCSGSVWVHFPALGKFGESHIECLSVVSASSNYDRTIAEPDYAFIKLVSPPKRPILKIDRGGFPANERMNLIRAVRGDSPLSHLITQSVCKSVLDSDVLPGSTSALSSMVTLVDCETDALSAGAPLVDSKGQLHGIVQAPFTGARLQKRIAGKPLIESTVAPLSTVTSVGCISLPGSTANGDEIADECFENPNLKDDLATQAQLQKLQSDVISRANQRNAGRADFDQAAGHWSARAINAKSREGSAVLQTLGLGPDYDYVAIPYPACDDGAPSSEIISRTERLPVIGFKTGYDRYLRPSMTEGADIGWVSARIDVATSPRPFYFTANRTATLFLIVNGVWTQIYQVSLPSCAKAGF